MVKTKDIIRRMIYPRKCIKIIEIGPTPDVSYKYISLIIFKYKHILIFKFKSIAIFRRFDFELSEMRGYNNIAINHLYT